jgi:multiple sugar transport system permease protein
MKQREWIGLGFVTPTVLYFIFISLLPMLYALWMSFHQWSLLSADSTHPFLLFDNYINLLSDEVFLRSVGNTFLYALVIVPVSILLALWISVMLNSGIKYVGLFRTIYFMPYITSGIAVGFIWLWLFEPTFGLFNKMLAPLGLHSEFLFSTKTSLLSISVVKIWKDLGFQILILLAGLQSIPKNIYEAAKLDGIKRQTIFWRITVPLLYPTLSFLLVIGVIRAFQIFGEVYVMTSNGGPLDSTRSIVYHIQETAFKGYEMGYGAAMTFVLFIIILVVSKLQQTFIDKRLKY